MSNHLREQSSPYLLQHADNPVDWYPWGREAFEKAESEDKPIFLSVGYSTCHWCHVMAHESFENKEIAEILNRYFVSVKVDREERPDVDSVYMSVCQALSGNGGWPMSIFMTAKQKPFFAGTYFPPTSRYGMIGFRDLLLTIADKWKSDRERLTETAENIVDQISTEKNDTCEKERKIDENMPKVAVKMTCGSFDAEYGGFGQAPKFPMPHNLLFLMLYAYLEEGSEQIMEQVKMTLMQMRRGGIFDQIGHGFSRYSTDRYYLVPHFEKMLYDNALLIIAYAMAYRLTDEAVFLDTAKKTADYILREMTKEEGAFYSAQDADSEGEEGKFYVWDHEEICAVLGQEKGKRFCEYYGITKEGNFEGRNIPHLLNGHKISEQFNEERKLLYQYRRSRAKLHLDDKILTSWNALTISAMAILYRVSGDRDYLEAARKAEAFLRERLMQDGILYVGCRNGMRFGKGFLDEYAYTAAACISLYEATADTVYLERAEKICQEAERQFADKDGGYFLYGAQNSDLIIRPKETYDGALPSGNSVMAYVLVRLLQLTQAEDHLSAGKQLAFLSGEAADYPAGHCMFLIALLYYLDPPPKITAVLTEADDAEQIMTHMPLWADITLLTQETAEYPLVHDKTTYYICKNHTCLPATNQAPFFHRDIS